MPRRHAADVDVVVVLADVHDDRAAASLSDRLERRDERHRRDEHLVARLDARRQEREAQRVEPARHPDAGAPAVRRRRLLELRTAGPFVKAFVSSSSATSARTLARTASVVTLRSTNGTSAVISRSCSAPVVKALSRVRCLCRFAGGAVY